MNESQPPGTLAAMKDVGDRIRQVRTSRDMTQDAFGAELGLTRGAVSNWESGKGIGRENLEQIAAKFGVSIDWLVRGDGPAPVAPPKSNVSKPTGPLYPRFAEPPPRLPVFGQAIGGADGYFILNGNKVADLFAPPSLVAVPEAYAVYVSGESMEPRYFAGEAVYVNPRLPIRRGDFVVVQIMEPDDDMPRGYVKRFVRMNDISLTLEQYNPPKELIFPREMVHSVHRIVMGGDS